MIQDILTSYNTYMTDIFGSNQYVMSVITLGILGFLGYLIKVLPEFIKNQFLKHVTTTVHIDSLDNGYYVIMKYLEDSKVINLSRFIHINNGPWGQGEAIKSIGVGTQLIYIMKTLCVVSLSRYNDKNIISYKLEITTLGRSHKFANKIMEVCNNPVRDKKFKDNIRLHLHKNETLIKCWQRKELVPYTILTKEAQYVLDKVKKFVSKEEKFIRRNIPFKLGVLLHGVPGTGKTKLIRIIAGAIDYEVHVVKDLTSLSNIPKMEKLIVVIEEVDKLLTQNNSTDKDKDNKDITVEKNSNVLEQALQMDLDGIYQQHGRITIMTTNNIKKLPAVLIRDGRVDIVKELLPMDTKTMKKLIKLHYSIDLDTPGLVLKNNIPISFIEKSIKEDWTKEQVLDYISVNR